MRRKPLYRELITDNRLLSLRLGFCQHNSEDKSHFQKQQPTAELAEKYGDDGYKEETSRSSCRTEYIAGDRFWTQTVPCNEIEEQRANNTYKYPHAEDDLIEEVKRNGICGLLSEKEVQAEQQHYTGKCTEQNGIKPFQVNHR